MAKPLHSDLAHDHSFNYLYLVFPVLDFGFQSPGYIRAPRKVTINLDRFSR